MKRFLLFITFLFFLFGNPLTAQRGKKRDIFTHADSLRGSVTPERAWWDVLYYDIHIRPDYETRHTSGSNAIRFRVIKRGDNMQIDLQEPLNIRSITWMNKPLPFTRDSNAYFVHFPKKLKPGNTETVLVNFEGFPKVAARAPWDGGWVFAKDKLGRPWMTVACEGTGASVWYPCKDYLGDEPDLGASLSIDVPDSLVAVANGRQKEKKSNGDGTSTYTWQVLNPINNYNIIPYIGKYVTWHTDYMGEKGKLDCDFWVIDYNLDKAKIQFLGVDSMLRCFEFWMGPYPFYEDGYKLVESPHLGMEHQSAIAYGNKFRQGYEGSDLSGSGWGLKWDFIIVHESGHEWFGNNITAKDIADEWIHESFTNYSETLYTGYYFGKEAADEYNFGTRKRIQNLTPIVGYYGVNKEPEGTDEYYKGGNMLHTIRQAINNDSIFRKIWRGLNEKFYHQTVTARQIETYISQQANFDFASVFEQYLRTTQIPVLAYHLAGDTLRYQWTNCVSGFNLPVKVNETWIKPTQEWQSKILPSTVGANIHFDRNMYFDSRLQ